MVQKSCSDPARHPLSSANPARALAAETLALERTLSDLVNQAYGLTPAEITLESWSEQSFCTIRGGET